MASVSTKRKHASSFTTTTKKPRLATTSSTITTKTTTTKFASSSSSDPPKHSSPLPLDVHQPLITLLSPKYNVLPLSVISSTTIQYRITRILTHLTTPTPDTSATSPSESVPGKQKHPVVLLHARPSNINKLITIIEKSKSLLASQKHPWFQYNRLFPSPEKPTKNKGPAAKRKVKIADATTIDETVFPVGEKDNGVVEKQDDDDDEEFFETKRKFRVAADPEKIRRETMSLSIWLAVESVPELRSLEGVSVQTSADTEE